jgi:tyrosyl-DNA phosphodiesterase-1
MAFGDTDPPAKRRKLAVDPPKDVLAATEHHNTESIYKGLTRSISPPLSRRKSPVAPSQLPNPTWGFNDVPKRALPLAALGPDDHQERESSGTSSTNYVLSPFQLTHIQNLAPHQNVDAVQLKDILGDPMIKECWNFNFLFDLDFVMWVISIFWAQGSTMTSIHILSLTQEAI